MYCCPTAAASIVHMCKCKQAALALTSASFHGRRSILLQPGKSGPLTTEAVCWQVQAASCSWHEVKRTALKAAGRA